MLFPRLNQGMVRYLHSTFRLTRYLSKICFHSMFAATLWGFGIITNFIGFPGGSDGKESACSAGDWGSIPGLGRSPEEVNGNPLQYSWPGASHGQRSLVGYSPWRHKELEITEHSVSMGLHSHKSQFLKSITN